MKKSQRSLQVPNNLHPSELSIGYEAYARPDFGVSAIAERAAFNAGSFYDQDPLSTSFRSYWDKVHTRSLLGAKAFLIYKLALQALSLDGDFIECGVYRGGLSFMLGMLLKDRSSAKLVHLHDTFTGLPEPDRTVDKSYVGGSMVCSTLEITEWMRSLGIERQCAIHKGLFEKTLLPGSPQRYALAHLDCDLYSGTKYALEHLFPRMAYTAPVILDDYYDESHGVMKATNEFAESHDIVIHIAGGGQAYFIVGEKPYQDRYVIDGHSVYLSFDAIRSDKPYLSMLEEVARYNQERVDMLRHFLALAKGDK